MAVKKLAATITSAGVTAGADITISHARVVSSTGTVKSKFKALATARTLPADGKLTLAPTDGFVLTKTGDLLGAVAAAYASNEAFLDGEFVNGDKIEWSTDGTNATARLAATAVTWAAATA